MKAQRQIKGNLLMIYHLSRGGGKLGEPDVTVYNASTNVTLSHNNSTALTYRPTWREFRSVRFPCRVSASILHFIFFGHLQKRNGFSLMLPTTTKIVADHRRSLYKEEFKVSRPAIIQAKLRRVSLTVHSLPSARGPCKAWCLNHQPWILSTIST